MPGPGQYSPTHIGPGHPAPAFHGAAPVQQRSGVPGPGAYSPQRADRLLHPASPACTLAAKLEEPGAGDLGVSARHFVLHFEGCYCSTRHG